MKKQTSSSPQGFGVPTEDSVKVIIETPKGSRNKFKYDPDLRMFKLSKVLPEGMVFPYVSVLFRPQRAMMEISCQSRRH